MPDKLSSDYQEVPPTAYPYNYDRLLPPFTAENTAAVESIKEFLSDSELDRARRLESVYFSPIFQTIVGTFIPGLRRYDTSFCLYLLRFNDMRYEDLVAEFLDAVYTGCPKEDLGGGHWGWFRVTIPNGDRYYPFDFHGNLQVWSDRLITVALEKGAAMGWFEKGKFCLTDGRQLAFGDLRIERLKGGEPIPDDW